MRPDIGAEFFLNFARTGRFAHDSRDPGHNSRTMSGMPGTGILGDFRLGDWLVQPSVCRLSRHGQTIQVRAKVMDLLAYLAAYPGEVVSKDRLLDDALPSQSNTASRLPRPACTSANAYGGT